MGLWDPLVKRSPNISMSKLPQSLEDREKTDLHGPVYKLETVRKGISVRNDSTCRHLSLVFIKGEVS